MLTFLSFDNFFLIKNVKLQIYLRISWRCSHGFTNQYIDECVNYDISARCTISWGKQGKLTKEKTLSANNECLLSVKSCHLGAHQKRIWTQRLLSLSITSYLCVNLLRINYHGLSIEWFFFSFLIDENNRCSFFNATDAYIILFHFWLYIHCTTSWPLHFTNIITILLIRIMVVYDATQNCVSIWAAHLLVIITAIITKFTVHENKALITENDVSSSNRCCRAVSP